MKRNWEIDELIEHWTLLSNELALLGNKTGVTRLGFAVFLKYFQLYGHFPPAKPDIPSVIINHVASQVNVLPEEYQQYNRSGRVARYHRNQIREFFDFRKAQVKDAKALVDWLVENVVHREPDLEHLKEIVRERFRTLKIEPPTPGRIEGLIRSALRTYENQLFQSTLEKLSPKCRAAIDVLLQTSDVAETANTSEDTPTKTSLFRYLNSSPSRATLNSLLAEISKLQQLRSLGLPDNLFRDVSLKVLQTYSTRAATEDSFQLRAHPEPIRYTLVAAFCWLKTQEVTDNLVDLLIQMIHRMSTKAEKKVDTQLVQDFKRVTGKHNILYRLANASLSKPEGTVKEVIYPVVGEKTLRDLVKEMKANGTTYQKQVHTVLRSSYSRHYRRALPHLLSVLEFRSNNDIHRPVIEALELLKKIRP